MNTKKKAETKTCRVTVPISKKEKEAIEKSAAQMGLTVASFVRLVVKEYLKQ
jgi:predicted DNA binding CopG/RHH family protein